MDRSFFGYTPYLIENIKQIEETDGLSPDLKENSCIRALKSHFISIFNLTKLICRKYKC